MPPGLSVFTMPRGIDRPELVTRDLIANNLGGWIDPFLVVSLFEMRSPLFPPHPHAGFSVATYIFPESQIGFWNQDTLGNRNLIPPGAFHLTVAGAGVMHEETVARSGRLALGLQIWIDHAAADREVTCCIASARCGRSNDRIGRSAAPGLAWHVCRTDLADQGAACGADRGY
jgi:redox-sensitive bicupin YhaK (pirin superfamily)